jgi:hypothetical protein
MAMAQCRIDEISGISGQLPDLPNRTAGFLLFTQDSGAWHGQATLNFTACIGHANFR